LGRQSRPVVLAGDRAVELSGDLGGLVPGGALVRGSVLYVERDIPGTRSTSIAFELRPYGGRGGRPPSTSTAPRRLAREAGVTLDRFAVVRRCPRWAVVWLYSTA
jgi:hypothetical protein